MVKKRPLLVLFFTIFLDMIGVGILIPVVPVLFTDVSSPHYLLSPGTSAETGYLLLGTLLAIFSLGQFLAAPVLGQFSDKFGRKKLLLLSIAGSIVGNALFALGIMWKAVPLLFVVRLLTGVTYGNIVVAQAAIADVTTPENRAKNFGMIGAAFGLGFIIGPFVGGKLADPSILPWFNATVPFWFSSALAVVNAILVIMYLSETNTHMAAKRDKKVEWAKAAHNIAHALKLHSIRPLFITNFIFQTGFTFYMTFASVYLLSHFGFTEGSIGDYFAYVGIWIVITQGLVTRYIAKYFDETSVVKNTIIATGLCILFIVLAPNANVLYWIVPFFAMAIGLTQANMTALISRSASAEIQGEILGLNGSIMALAQTIPPLLAGIIAAKFEPHAPLIIASLLTICAGLYFIDHLRRLRLR